MSIAKDNLIPLLGTLYPWRRYIVYVTAAAFILSIIGTLLMKNYYRGKTIFYAASQDLFKPDKVFGNTQSEMYYYGSGEDIDRILTIGNSNDVLDHLIDTFNLWEAYKIKPGTPRSRYRMRNALKENYNILLTKQDALELTIEDTDRERAAAIANSARNLIDTKVRNIIKNSQIEITKSFQKSIQNKQALMQNTLDTLVYYRRKSGVYDSHGQTEILAARVTEVSGSIERQKAALEALKSVPNLSSKLKDSLQLIKARIAGDTRELAFLNSPDTGSHYSLINFNISKGKVEALESQYARAYDQISFDIEKMKIYNAAANINVSALHLIEAAEAPLFKARPKRSLIVLACTVAAFLFSLGAVLLIESYRRMDWSGVSQPPSL